MTPSNNTTAHDSTDRVVILGSGYGGMHALRTLNKLAKPSDDLGVVMISPVDHFLYVTMIYEVAVGNLAPSSIRQPVRSMMVNNSCEFRQGAASAVDTQNKTVTYRTKDTLQENHPGGEVTVSYDYLLSAIGSETNFFGTPGAAEHALTLKTLPDAIRIKNTLLDRFEQAQQEMDEERQKELLSFVVVGGGSTGVTLTAKIADLLNDEIAAVYPELIKQAQVTVIEGEDQLVTQPGPWFARHITSSLKHRKRVQVITGTYVDKVREDGVECSSDFYPARTVIWTAGVKARELDFGDAAEIDENTARVHVNRKLHLPNFPDVFVVGDQAWVANDSGDPYPMRAQFATRQGRLAAKNMLAAVREQPMDEFEYKDKGIVISAGHGRTYADVLGIKMTGLPATLAYKSIYLMSTIGVRNKLRAILEWVMNLFLPRDISEL